MVNNSGGAIVDGLSFVSENQEVPFSGEPSFAEATNYGVARDATCGDDDGGAAERCKPCSFFGLVQEACLACDNGYGNVNSYGRVSDDFSIEAVVTAVVEERLPTRDGHRVMISIEVVLLIHAR